MKKLFFITILCGLTLTAAAVPAKREWRTYTQPDGTSIELMLVGDEFCHYTINRDGQRVKQNPATGFYEVAEETLTPELIKARRAKAQARRQRKDVGTTPNLAPRGVVILVNFNDTKMKAAHTLAVFDELCNATNCTVNTYGGIKYPSAAQYFADQSGNTYRPIFDVFGPVELDSSYVYYGQNVDPTDYESDDKYATDAVIEACIKANEQFDIDFTKYDSDNDGYVDFVYVIYAGKGAADGGSMNTIWPHNWSIQAQIYYASQYPDDIFTNYERSDTRLDGVYLDNYAMSQELSGSSLAGIGTLCHEFGHVMGLPDFYDTDYKTNYKQYLTPNEWDIMDGGSYNGGMHCPPNYSPWEKYFFGWLTPENLGNEAQHIVLTANGQEGYKAYQINLSATQQEATEPGECFYLENRQQLGWDRYVPADGLLIWKVNFNEEAWVNNAPNNTSTSGSPLYTVVCSQGTKIGEKNGAGNVFPNDTINSCWLARKNIENITNLLQKVSFDYSVTGEGIETVSDEQKDGKATKILRDNQLIIRCGNKEYTPLGLRLK